MAFSATYLKYVYLGCFKVCMSCHLVWCFVHNYTLTKERHARVERGSSNHPSPFSVKLNQVSFCQSLCLCVVIWKIICTDESQWEIVLITTPKDGSVIVFVVLMRRSTSDDGRVIDKVKCFVSYAGLPQQHWAPFFG